MAQLIRLDETYWLNLDTVVTIDDNPMSDTVTLTTLLASSVPLTGLLRARLLLYLDHSKNAKQLKTVAEIEHAINARRGVGGGA